MHSFISLRPEILISCKKALSIMLTTLSHIRKNWTAGRACMVVLKLFVRISVNFKLIRLDAYILIRYQLTSKFEIKWSNLIYRLT